jgi:hypothetical protein
LASADNGRDGQLIRTLTHADPQTSRIGTAYTPRSHSCAMRAGDDVSRFVKKKPTRLGQLDLP